MISAYCSSVPMSSKKNRCPQTPVNLFHDDIPEFDAASYERKVMGALTRAQFGREFDELEGSWEKEETWPTDAKSDVFDPLCDDSDDDGAVFTEPGKQGYSALREVMRIRRRRGSDLGEAVHKLGNFAGSDDSDEDACSESQSRASVSKLRALSPLSPSKRRDSKPVSPAVSASKPRRVSLVGLSGRGSTSPVKNPGRDSAHTPQFVEMMKATKSESTKQKGAMTEGSKASATKTKGRKGIQRDSKISCLAAVDSFSMTPKNRSCVDQESEQGHNTIITASKTPKNKARAASPPVVKGQAKTPKSSAKRLRQALSDDDSGTDVPLTTPKKKGTGYHASRKGAPAVPPLPTPTSRRSGLRV